MITTKINQHVFSFETKNNVGIFYYKYYHHIINNFKTKISREFIDFQDKHFVQWSLYAGNKKPGTSFKWLLVTLYRQSLYREKFDLKA